MSIRVSNISKKYGEQLALDAVSFDVEKGEIVGFLGPNGAGKSTLMKILTTYLSPSEGTSEVNGFNVAEDPLEVQKSIGYLPEHNPLYTEMYVREYLEYNASIHKIPKATIDGVIEITGLDAESHKKIGQLSKGYRQRVGLACALLHDPEVLILDEPTTGLDPNQLVEVRELIRKIGSEKTVLLSTHIMQEVEAICDRVIIINNGKLVYDKPIKEVLNSEKQILEVEFDYRVEESLLKKLPKVKSVKNLGGFQYRVQFEGKEDMRGSIFDFAREHELKILQLNSKNPTLEKIFNELTTRK